MKYPADTIAYTKHLLTRNFGFREEPELSEKLGFDCLSCSARDALMLVSYSCDLMFLLDEGSAFKLVPPECKGGWPFQLIDEKGSLKTVFDGQELLRRAGPPSVEIVSIKNGRWDICSSPIHKNLDELRRKCPDFFVNRKVLVFWKPPPRLRPQSWRSWEKIRNETFESLLKAIKSARTSFSDFLPVELRPGPFFVTEDIFRYAGGMVLRNIGYLITDFRVADINAFRIPNLNDELKDMGIISCGGFLLEIALHEILDSVKVQGLPALATENQLIAALIEVEGDPSHTKTSSIYAGFGQVERYMKKHEFINQAFVCGPICPRTHQEIGTISFMLDGSMFFHDAKILPRDVSSICGYVEAFVRKLLF